MQNRSCTWDRILDKDWAFGLCGSNEEYYICNREEKPVSFFGKKPLFEGAQVGELFIQFLGGNLSQQEMVM